MEGFYCFLIRSETDRAAPVSQVTPPARWEPGRVGLRREMLRPHLTLPGTRQDSRLCQHDSHLRLPAHPPRSPERSLPYREPLWPLSLGPAPAFTSAAGTAVGTRRPPAELGESKAAPCRLSPASSRSCARRGQPGWKPPPLAARPMTGKLGARPRAAGTLRPIVAQRRAHPIPAPRPPRPCGASCHRGCRGRTWAAAAPRARGAAGCSHPDQRRSEISGGPTGGAVW